MFKIGDKVVYPMHGAGIIEGIEEKEFLGKCQRYYVLRLPIKEMKVMLPTENVDRLGLRDIVPEGMISEVITILGSSQSIMSGNWNRRYRDNMEKVKTGDIHDVAEVVRDLQLMEKEKGLSTGERKMLSNTRQILVSELVLVKNIGRQEVELIIDSSIYQNQ
jgi:CarD family transcriptional regulator